MTKSGLAVVSTVLVGSSASRLKVPVNHVVKKLIVPNDITIENPGCETVKQLLIQCSEAEGRIIILKEFYRRASTTITINLPTGKLGITLKSNRNTVWVGRVSQSSQLLQKVPIGYHIESLVIPDELELVGYEELVNATYLASKLSESSHVPRRILVLRQYSKDIQKRKIGAQKQHELV